MSSEWFDDLFGFTSVVSLSKGRPAGEGRDWVPGSGKKEMK